MTEENTEEVPKKCVGVPFKKGDDPRRNTDGRPKGTRDWSTDFEEAIKKISKRTGVSTSEIRTDLLVKGITEARKGNHNFWKEIVERNYGKSAQPIEGDIKIRGAEDLAKFLQESLNESETENNNQGTD